MLKENGMVLISEKELNEIVKDANNRITELESRIKMLQKATMDLLNSKGKSNKDIRVSKLDFLALYNDALNEMFDQPDEDENDIYGYDITIHWHGIYCNCGDGATAYNNIIPAIENVYNEDDEEY